MTDDLPERLLRSFFDARRGLGPDRFMDGSYADHSPRTLRFFLEIESAERLQARAALCGNKTLTRKAECVEFLMEALSTTENLHRLWDRMDKRMQSAVSQAVHNGGELDERAFVARFGTRPERADRYDWRAKPTLLDLLIYDDHIPSDLLPRLEAWVPRLEPFRLSGAADLPPAIQRGRQMIELHRAYTEQSGSSDLATLLRLVELGAWRVSATSGQPTLPAVHALLPLLHAGDFWPPAEHAKAPETIRPIGLNTFALLGGFVEHRGRAVEQPVLTDAGREWLRTQSPALLLAAFEEWEQTFAFDELARIRAIKGQTARGTVLSSPPSRREKIVEALSWCPAGVWINLEDFFRAMAVWQFRFTMEMTVNSNLYVGHSRDDGWLEYSANSYWRIVGGLYTQAVLWETLATIGALDIAFVPPAQANLPFAADLPGWDGQYLSPYDGLTYFRINDLGAYLLGQHDSYVPLHQTRPPFLRIDDELMVQVDPPDAITPADRLMLQAFTTPAGQDRYRLDIESLLTALEKGRDLQEGLAFLAEWHAGPLPARAQALFADAGERGRAFSLPRAALSIQVRDAELARWAVCDPKLKRICQLADNDTIVIPANREATFRKRLRELGYVVPR